MEPGAWVGIAVIVILVCGPIVLIFRARQRLRWEQAHPLPPDLEQVCRSCGGGYFKNEITRLWHKTLSRAVVEQRIRQRLETRKTMPIKTEMTTQVRLTQAFVDALREAHDTKPETETEDDFHRAVLLAAGGLVCSVEREAGMSKKRMLEHMGRIWDHHEKPGRKRETN